jgi:ATP-dependent DNA helicase PIF1
MLTRFPTEYLNTLSVNGIPPHRLVMELGAPIMLLRNINPKEGLCNGTRLILKSKNGQVLKCERAGGERDGNIVSYLAIPNAMEKATISSSHFFRHDHK